MYITATLYYAEPALKLAGVPHPPLIVTANDVKFGKPHPEPYVPRRQIHHQLG